MGVAELAVAGAIAFVARVAERLEESARASDHAGREPAIAGLGFASRFAVFQRR